MSDTTPLGAARLATECDGPGGTVTVVCLLIALSRTIPGTPLLVAANRDELYARPADPITVLRGERPRILGGRDELAGGTWLAVNSAGVLAGLTNQPSASRDATKRSRGELPLAFAAYPDAATAVAEVCGRLDPADYNPCWLLVGDRHTLFSIDLTGGPRPAVQELPPGNYVLENAPLRRGSAKQQRVAGLVGAALAADGVAADGAGAAADSAGAAAAALATVLCDHRASGWAAAAAAGRPAPARRDIRRLRAHGAVRHPLGHDRQRAGRRPAQGAGSGRAPVHGGAAGPDQPVDQPGARRRGGAGRFAVIASIPASG